MRKSDSKQSPARDACPACHASDSESNVTQSDKTSFPDHSESLRRLRRIQGQLNGIEKMILDRRYCFDILTQFRAATAALQAVESAIFERHLKMCVKETLESKDMKAAETKIHELLTLMRKRPYAL